MITLNHIMKANAASCILFGVMFIAIPDSVTAFLSAEMPAPQLLLQILGAGLIANGIHLIWASLKPIPNKWLTLYFSIGDYLWVVGSVALVLSRVWIDTTAGIITTLVVAVMVGVFGVLQMRKLKMESKKRNAKEES